MTRHGFKVTAIATRPHDAARNSPQGLSLLTFVPPPCIRPFIVDQVTGLAMLQSRSEALTFACAAAFVALTVVVAKADDVLVKRFSGGDAASAVGIADASEDVELT